MILRLHKARPLQYRESPYLHDFVAKLAERSGIDRPTLAIYPSDVPNAFAMSARREEGFIAGSTGLT